MSPPFLRARISRHQSHIDIVVFADILEIGKQEAVFLVDRLVANPALGGSERCSSGGAEKPSPPTSWLLPRLRELRPALPLNPMKRCAPSRLCM
jgi:hypothetical protein